ncbi:MAG: efflux transporter outer membrane subunit [Limisphaerales bacterium]
MSLEIRRSTIVSEPLPGSVATLLCLALTALFAGCAVGPDYERPTLDTPASFRRAASDAGVAGTNSLADLGWGELARDETLRGYLAEALTNNWDVRIAATRVLQAEASLRVTRSQFLPSIAAGGDVFTTRTSQVGPAGLPSGVDPQKEFGDVYLAASTYEVDLWGRIRRATEAARARLVATEAARQAVRQTLVTDVTSTYLQLLQFDHALEIARRSLINRTNSLVLTTAREDGGVASLQDVAQSRILVATAEASIVDTLRLIEQTENAFCLLLGRNPGPILRDVALTERPVQTEVPAGLPSSLLERRPDLRFAEGQLRAANADVGQAKATFYPQVTLTGNYGFQSVSLSDLFTAPAQAWKFGPTVTFPLFTGGRLRGSLQLARAQFEEAVAQYQQASQAAFRDVSDSLIAFQRLREYRSRLEQRLAAELANLRYDGGMTSYLEVLYSEQELFDAELALSRAQLNELLSVVQVYRALGGGWQMDP